jgi:hypothetical protein
VLAERSRTAGRSASEALPQAKHHEPVAGGVGHLSGTIPVKRREIDVEMGAELAFV